LQQLLKSLWLGQQLLLVKHKRLAVNKQHNMAGMRQHRRLPLLLLLVLRLPLLRLLPRTQGVLTLLLGGGCCSSNSSSSRVARHLLCAKLLVWLLLVPLLLQQLLLLWRLAQ
jgi:hypothetical protein